MSTGAKTEAGGARQAEATRRQWADYRAARRCAGGDGRVILL